VPRQFDLLSRYISQALGLSEEACAEAYCPATPSQLPQILALRRSVNGDDIWWDDERFVQWRYFSRLTGGTGVPYWVFTKDGEVLGACGLEPVTLVIDAQPVPAVRTLDIMVRPDLDGLGLGVFMNLMLFKHFPITLVTGSNEKSHQLLKRMFHHTVDLRFWKAAIRARAIMHEKVNLGPLSSVVAPPVDLVLEFLRARRRLAPPDGITIKPIASFDSRVVELSRRCELSGRLVVRRSDEYLNWRFAQNPRCRHHIFGAFRGEDLEGYVVARLNLARPNPRRQAEIVDWLAMPVTHPSDSVLPALIQAATEQMIRDGAGIVSCAGVSDDLAPAMSATGFRFRPAERLPFFVRAADPEVHRRLTSGCGWYLTRGDWDVE
jgi:hypothetical protein